MVDTELEREVKVNGRTFILKKDPRYGLWTIWNKANNYVWDGTYTNYTRALQGAKQLYAEQEKPPRVKKVHLTPREKKET